MDEKKLKSIHRLAMISLFVILLLGGGFLWGEFKNASGIDTGIQSASAENVQPVEKVFTGNNKYAAGKDLFYSNCARCHRIDRRMTGPALAGATDRWKDSTAIRQWIKNSQQYITKTNDPYAVKLYKSYNSIMPPFANLSDADITEILHYITPDE